MAAGGSGITDLRPGTFAVVMATGIVSLAASLLQLRAAATALFRIAEVTYGLIWLLTIVRALRHFPRMARDLTDHAVAPEFFTTVAATGVLGAQFVVLSGDLATARGLWILGGLLWVLLIYVFFTAVTIRRRKPSLEAGLSGAWLLAVVATQSIALLGALLASDRAGPHEDLVFASLALHLLGWVLYVLLGVPILYRLVFHPLDPEALSPTYWINMGALAISTLAGTTLLAIAPPSALLAEVRPFLMGFAVLFWAASTWWIPLLLSLGAWRHLYRRVPFRYDVSYWAMVFPLGMYAVSTFHLAQVTHLGLLEPLARGAAYVALVAWGVVAGAAGTRLLGAVRRRG